MTMDCALLGLCTPVDYMIGMGVAIFVPLILLAAAIAFSERKARK